MKLYNTLSKKIEVFTPHEKKKVKMYVCGITPYDTTHLGHAFTYLSYDVLVRYLKYKGNEVVYTQNVTDINDRDNDILKRAKEQNIPWQNLSNFWTDKFLHDMHALNWTMPDNFLFASAHIPAMIELIDKLLKNGCAYQIDGGIYLDVKKIPDFGKLSQFSEKKMLSVAKDFDEDIDNSDKRNQLDITLWRPTMPNQPDHIPSFESSYGPGRPGWHLECSSMSLCSLGEQIDIHGGGKDLIYPHHESEIAQSEQGTGKKPFAKYWLHTGIVSYEGRKMSKSLGNLVLVSDLMQKYSPNSIRFLLLSNHYRSDWEFKESELNAAENKISQLINGLQASTQINEKPGKRFLEFESAMENDMDTTKALEIMLEAGIEEKKKIADILGFVTSY